MGKKKSHPAVMDVFHRDMALCRLAVAMNQEGWGDKGKTRFTAC